MFAGACPLINRIRNTARDTVPLSSIKCQISAQPSFSYPRIARFVRILGNKIFVRYCTYLTIWAVACIVFSEVNIWNRSTYSILLKFLLQHIFVFWKQYCMLYCKDLSALFQPFRYKGQGSIPVITTTAKKCYLLKFRL